MLILAWIQRRTPGGHPAVGVEYGRGAEKMVKKTKGICAFCGKPVYQTDYDEHYHKGRWRHYVGADGKQAGHIAKPKQN